MPWKFSKVNPIELTRFVIPKVPDKLGLRLNVANMMASESGKLRIVQSIYHALDEKKLQYALDDYTPSLAVQHIRKPSEILDQSQGTCLDLALMFAGLCLAYELLPIVILLQGHAFVAVSMTHRLQQWNAWGRKEYEKLFTNVLLPEPTAFIELIRSGAYLPIECTGFARSMSIPERFPEGRGRDHNGAMTFERAVQAGREQLEAEDRRPFRCALDIAVAHHFWEIRPSAADVGTIEEGHASMPEPPQGLLPYLCDRSEQEINLKEAVLFHRAMSPRRPLICVVHGDEKECHSEFFGRMTERTLPNILGHWYPEKVKKVPCVCYTAVLSLEKYTPGQFRTVIEQEFKRATNNDGNIYQQIASHRLYLVVNFANYSEKCKDDSLWKMSAFLQYWSELDNLPPDLLFIVCVNFRYRSQACLAEYPFHQRWLIKRRNRKTKELVNRLHRTQTPGITCVALSELQPVSQVEAEMLVKHELVMHFYNLKPRDVERLYERKELCVKLGIMQMGTLIDNLDRLYMERNVHIR
jgi:hypothetical protein